MGRHSYSRKTPLSSKLTFRLPGADEYDKSLRQLGNDDRKAFQLNAAAAERGEHDAVLAMGWFHLNGVGVKPSIPKATYWYKKAARQGDPLAFSSLGQIAGLQRDFRESVYWLTKAAEQGHFRSKYFLGKLYWRGNGVEPDRKVARRLFADAASMNVSEAKRVERFLAYLGRRKAQNSQGLQAINE